MPSERVDALVLIDLPEPLRATVLSAVDARFDVSAQALTRSAENATVRVVLTNGARGLDAVDIEALPALELICSIGVGHENIDVAYARSKNITVTNGAGVNADIVADHAMALLLAVVRSIPSMDRAARAETSLLHLRVDPGLHGKRLGLLGGGHISEKIAKRVSGFDMQVGYHARSDRGQLAHPYFATLQALAQWCDVLVIAVPGGPQTLHMVDRDILRALGPTGYLVNVGRGSVVDTAALADALEDRAIAGAALDVYESEPFAPTVLLDFDNVVLSPHIGGRSVQAAAAQINVFLNNVERLTNQQAFINVLQ
ncbi:NAD(P)-dependent oxidoreductase [Pseudomonas sp. PD9R]|uniref:NAD(P)-dependent oxidoreductase n=1 Tax=Pseudomonas sp. PD9R TaxID=2853534 RepID=UPI001C440936|nr:NAD(P)-dependent oxidoreductase [Pseudomonas sp. PD9R]MBV6826518.1 2-hydroxyacid dehydrogenase [Pseudomonas sp. PD9R]